MPKPPALPARYLEAGSDRSATTIGCRETKQVAIMIRLPASARRDLKIIAAKRLSSVQALITEQLNDVLVKHGMEPIAQTGDRRDEVSS